MGHRQAPGGWARRPARRLSRLGAALLVAVVPPLGTRVPPPLRAPVRVELETAVGVIDLEVDPDAAPLTAANFLRYVDTGQYDGGRFHRTVRPGTETNTAHPIALIQASRAPGSTGFAPIALERTRLGHVDGAVAMARSSAATATSDFFICVGDQPALDAGGARPDEGGGLAVFGRVVAGMSVVRQIQAAPVFPGTQALQPPIPLTRVRRARAPLPFVEARAILPLFVFVRG